MAVIGAPITSSGGEGTIARRFSSVQRARVRADPLLVGGAADTATTPRAAGMSLSEPHADADRKTSKEFWISASIDLTFTRPRPTQQVGRSNLIFSEIFRPIHVILYSMSFTFTCH